MQQIEAQIAREGSWYGELTHTTRDGRTIIAESRLVRVSYDGERETYVLETNRDITERKAHEEHVRLLVREVNHRAKNMLSVVNSIAHQIAAKTPEDFVERFTERIKALSANQDLLVRNEWKGVGIDHLVRAQLAHFADLIGSRIGADGPTLELTATAAEAIGFALYELATNAGKYGALSTDRGRVDICWCARGDTFDMKWTERGGPSVSAPEGHGFGTTVMKNVVERSLGGTVDVDFAPSGLIWRLTCRTANAVEPGNRDLV
jgi:two-component sensor histidine kinase